MYGSCWNNLLPTGIANLWIKYWSSYCKTPNNFFLASSAYSILLNAASSFPEEQGFVWFFWLDVGFPEDPLTQMSTTWSPSEENCTPFSSRMRGGKSCAKINLSDLLQSSTLGVLQVVFMHRFCSCTTQPGKEARVTLECCVLFVAEQVCLSDPFNLFHSSRTQGTPSEMTH